MESSPFLDLGSWIQRQVASTHMTSFDKVFGAVGPAPTPRFPKPDKPAQSEGKPDLRAALRNRGGARKSIVAAVPEELEEDGTSPKKTTRLAVPRLALGRAANPGGLASARSARGMRVGGGAMSSRGTPTDEKAKGRGLVGQFNEFLARGTPRPNGAGSGVPSGWLKDRIAAWGKTRGIDSTVAPRLQALRAMAWAASDSSNMAMEASVVWLGVEVLVAMSVCMRIEGHADASTVTRAHTRCGWPLAQKCIGVASQQAAGSSMEAFLEALVRTEVWSEALGEDTNEESAPAQAEEEADGQEGGDAEASASDHVSVRSFDDVEEEEDEDDDSSSCSEAQSTNEFAEWLCDRPPLWRFAHQAQGMAWDWPQSQQEKHELLMLGMFAEEELKHQRM